MFSLKPPKPTFKSYLLPLPQSEDHITAEPRIKKLEPILLPGMASYKYYRSSLRARSKFQILSYKWILLGGVSSAFFVMNT